MAVTAQKFRYKPLITCSNLVYFHIEFHMDMPPYLIVPITISLNNLYGKHHADSLVYQENYLIKDPLEVVLIIHFFYHGTYAGRVMDLGPEQIELLYSLIMRRFYACVWELKFKGCVYLLIIFI